MKKLFAFLPVFLLFIFPSCRNHQKIVLTGNAQGTYYAITYFDEENKNFRKEIDSLLTEFDQIASLWVENSVISKVNRNDTSSVLNDIFIELFDLSMEVSEKTDGAFDFTAGPLISAWGFSFREKIKMDQQKVDSILKFTGYEKIKIKDGKVIKEDPRIQLDFNAIAQGYSVDLVADFLRSKGIDRFLVDIGGEVYASSTKPHHEQWKVGIEKPVEDPSAERQLKAVVFLKNKALATSGNYRKFYVEDGVKYSHTIDPETGYPARHSLLSTSVMADKCAIADAYATAFLVMGLEKAKKYISEHDELEGYFIYAGEDGELRIWYTPGMNKLIYE